MNKVELIKKKSYSFIRAIGIKALGDDPELLRHMLENKPVRVTIEAIEQKEIPLNILEIVDVPEVKSNESK